MDFNWILMDFNIFWDIFYSFVIKTFPSVSGRPPGAFIFQKWHPIFGFGYIFNSFCYIL